MSDATISVIEYDITAIPGGFSHIGIRISFAAGQNYEFNYGSFLNGEYRPYGLPFDPRDQLGVLEGALAMPSHVVYMKTLDEAYVQSLFFQIQDFNSRLVNADIGYAPAPNHEARQGNSNSAAFYVMRLLGIEPSIVNFLGSGPIDLN